MKTLGVVVFLMIMPFFSTTGFSQEKWFGEFKPNLNFPVSDENIKTGYGFDLAAGYQFMPHLNVYLGWGWNQFKSDNNFFIVGDRYDLEETGYKLGFQFIHPLSSISNISFLLKVGGIYNHIEIENIEGNLVADSGHGWGWEAGAGLAIGIGMNWSIMPQFGYRSLTREIEIEEVSKNFDLNYLSLAVGISKKF